MASSETQTDCLTRSPELPRPCKERKSGAPPYAVVDSQRMPEAGPPSPAYAKGAQETYHA